VIRLPEPRLRRTTPRWNRSTQARCAQRLVKVCPDGFVLGAIVQCLGLLFASLPGHPIRKEVWLNSSNNTQKALDSIPSSRYSGDRLVGMLMNPTAKQLESRHESKPQLLNVALHVIRAKGYSATRIEDICEAAFGETNDDCATTFRRGIEVSRRQFENNCKLRRKQNGKSANDGARALCHDELPPVLQREQPFHQHCGSKCT
jgi:hypothetical protein